MTKANIDNPPPPPPKKKKAANILITNYGVSQKEVFIFLIFIMVQNYCSWGGTTWSNVYMFKTLCKATNNAIKGQTDHYLFILPLAVLLLPFKFISISVGKHFKFHISPTSQVNSIWI